MRAGRAQPRLLARCWRPLPERRCRPPASQRRTSTRPCPPPAPPRGPPAQRRGARHVLVNAARQLVWRAVYRAPTSRSTAASLIATLPQLQPAVRRLSFMNAISAVCTCVSSLAALLSIFLPAPALPAALLCSQPAAGQPAQPVDSTPGRRETAARRVWHSRLSTSVARAGPCPCGLSTSRLALCEIRKGWPCQRDPKPVGWGTMLQSAGRKGLQSQVLQNW